MGSGRVGWTILFYSILQTDCFLILKKKKEIIVHQSTKPYLGTLHVFIAATGTCPLCMIQIWSSTTPFINSLILSSLSPSSLQSLYPSPPISEQPNEYTKTSFFLFPLPFPFPFPLLPLSLSLPFLSLAKRKKNINKISKSTYLPFPYLKKKPMRL